MKPLAQRTSGRAEIQTLTTIPFSHLPPLPAEMFVERVLSPGPRGMTGTSGN